MKPIYAKDTPRNIEKDLNIGWDKLITSGKQIESEEGIEYLEGIKKYCNNDGIPDGINAKVFEYGTDNDFERLLSVVHVAPSLEADLIPFLFTKTGIKNYLTEFSSDTDELKTKIAQSEFKYLDPFKIEGELACYLYYYGMYDYFYNNNPPLKAVEVSRRFTELLYSSDPGNVICFQSKLPWGTWFDIYSHTDRSFVFINKKERKIYLFCFSHSD